MSVAAHNAAIMLCRKLLLHLGIRAGLPAKDKSNRSPSFERAIKHLVDEGCVRKMMQPWVDQIRKVGNEANHELPQVTSEQAEMVARFTQQLLMMTYEYPSALDEVEPLPPEDGPEA
jgi:hypothetical protein